MDPQQLRSELIRARDRLERAKRDVATFVRLIGDGRLGADIGVTCRGKTDGAGAQAMAAVSAMTLARCAGCRYFHSPFTSVSHAPGARADWARRWEAFLNFGDNETLLPESAELIPLSAVLQDPEALKGRPVVIAEEVFGMSDTMRAAVGDSLRADLRAKYWRSPKAAIPSHRAPSGYTAAIHVRRGDVSETSSSNRYVRDEHILRQIARLRMALAPFTRPLTVNLYSEGVPEDFRAFADAGCNLHISEDTFETFHNMVTADILMGAYSTFSYLASFLSCGIVLDQRRRAPALANYLRRRADGNISIKQLRRALLSRMGWVDRTVYFVRRRLGRSRPVADSHPGRLVGPPR